MVARKCLCISTMLKGAAPETGKRLLGKILRDSVLCATVIYSVWPSMNSRRIDVVEISAVCAVGGGK